MLQKEEGAYFIISYLSSVAESQYGGQGIDPSAIAAFVKSVPLEFIPTKTKVGVPSSFCA
jgi:hypothetical protein